LSTVTAAADLLIGLGDPLQEILQFDFQASASAWKHADLMAYNSLAFAHYHVPVHTIVLLLRRAAAPSNLIRTMDSSARPGRGSMHFTYELIRLWERGAEELLSADLGVVPLAVLGRLPEGLSLEEGLAVIAQRIVERVVAEAPLDRAKKLLTD